MIARMLLAVVMTALAAPALAGDWPRGSLAEAGLPADTGERLDAMVAAGDVENLHAVLVARRGKLVLERYYAGPDQKYGRDLGIVRFDAKTLHDVRSISKSIVGLLYGIALADGKVPAPDTPLVDGFRGVGDLARDEARRRIRVENALTMTLGFEWNERLPYTSRANSEIAMEYAPDRVRYVLSRPIVSPPGETWTYSGGSSALLGRLIEGGTGQSLLAYGRERLFGPLGITDVTWSNGSDGRPAAASGLRMRPLDLARIGQMVLDGGRWEGRQVVPADWLAESFKTRARVNERLTYGYQWWLGGGWPGGLNFVGGFGNGGQRLFVVPKRDLVVVAFAGNYNRRAASRSTDKVMNELIMAPLIEE